jgi:hypothetical protein
MARHRLPTPLLLGTSSWGDLASSRLHANWLGRVWEADETSLLLVGRDGEVIRFVTPEIGDGPFHVVAPRAAAEEWRNLPRDQYVWRVGHDLWIGDDLTLHLPTGQPWASNLHWPEATEGADEEVISRHLALLADWLLARGPEGSLAGVLPELLVAGGPIGKDADRPYLPLHARLFRWRAARVLGDLFPALAGGDMAAAEEAVNSLAGLGPGTPPAGDSFMLGFIAGVQLWPRFLSEGSGLRDSALLKRLVRSVVERTSLLGRATLAVALEDHWDARWHELCAALIAAESYPDDLRNRLLQIATEWLEQDEPTANGALSGLVMPFLWHQRVLT